MLDIKRIRKNFKSNKSRTHYEDCEYIHSGCAIEALCKEVEKLQKIIDWFQSGTDHNTEILQSMRPNE